MKMETKLDLSAIRARCDAVTPGLWKKEKADEVSEVIRIVSDVCKRTDYIVCTINSVSAYAWGNINFIANARQDIPALLDEVERLTKILESMAELAKENIPQAIDRLVEYESLIPIETAREWTVAHDEGRLYIADNKDIVVIKNPSPCTLIV
jgi:hypothetical protein